MILVKGLLRNCCSKFNVNSLATRLILAVVIWALLVGLFTGYTLSLLWQLEAGGIMINQSGSLRMRTYHIATLLGDNLQDKAIIAEQQNINKILKSLKQVPLNNIFATDNKQILLQIETIESKWQHDLADLISLNLSLGSKVTAKQLLVFEQMVNTIDKLVYLIEQKNTRHIKFLRFMQSLLLIIVLISVFGVIYGLYKFVIHPLNKIKQALASLSTGKLDERITIVAQSEFMVIAQGFNQMATNLQESYANLEHKIKAKTFDLRAKNRELSTMYEMTTFLQQQLEKNSLCQGFLLRIIGLTNADAGSIRLLNEEENGLNYVASYGLNDEFMNHLNCCSLTCDCGLVIANTTNNTTNNNDLKLKQITPALSKLCAKYHFKHLMVFSIGQNLQKMGILTLYFASKNNEITCNNDLIKVLVSQLVVALKNQQLILKDKQLAIMKERNLIAQGLHDSIAQSLSFLNMQAQMLRAALDNQDHNQDQNKIKQIMQFIECGINESYDDVRELLLNFRVDAQQEDFASAVKKLLDNFKHKHKININLELSGFGPPLKSNQQTQIIFIMQEALSNIRKHAKCSRVDVTINNDKDFKLTIKDNGVGFSMHQIAHKKAQHVGLNIMQERAAQIKAVLYINSAIGKGVTIDFILAKKQREIL